jgi:hypothetical protein
MLNTSGNKTCKHIRQTSGQARAPLYALNLFILFRECAKSL